MLCVPEELNRNSSEVHAAGAENTGSEIMSLVAERLSVPDLGNYNILDLGCGVRFTQAIVNRGVPICSYTGVDVYKPLIDFLKSEVTDPRFTFAWWNVHNDQYNPTGHPMRSSNDLPVKGDYDIVWLFSVFTHLFPHDAEELLKIMRKHVHHESKLIFTAFIADDVSTFENRETLPGIRACYNGSYMNSLLETAGWRLQSLEAPNLKRFVQHLLVCRPN